MRKESTKMSSILHAFAIGGLLTLAACSSPKDNSDYTNSLMTKDMQESPPSSAQETPSSAIDKSDLYSKGCKQIGQAQPVLELDPKLSVNDAFIVEESRTLGNTTFDIKYDRSLSALPTANGPLIYTGQIENITMTGFMGAITNHGDNNVTKKCAILDVDSALEKCYPEEISYTNNFLDKYNGIFKTQPVCTFTAVAGKTPQEKWSVGQYTMENNKQIKTYIHRLQTALIQKCNGVLGKAVQTEITITSNDVVSDRYSHCGGEVMFKKTTIRNVATGMVLSQKTYAKSLAPVKP